MLWKIFCLVSCLKLLLLYAYKSTDYEVHRNWLAITFSSPISRWYFEETSQWTLDYPPLFAYFEYLLSLIAYYFDSNMLVTKNLNYDSPYTLYFQRLSVILSDLVLAYGCKEIRDFITVRPLRRKSSKWKSLWRSPASAFYVLVLANFGLFIVDHIHFQYNGFLFGFLLISIAKILKGSYVSGLFWFSILLYLKHIYIYMVPAYAIYLLKNYCLTFEGEKLMFLSSFKKLVKLFGVAFMVTFFSLGPFMLMGQLQQLASRLFPFKRGLCHSYWAPNFWAFYNIIDKGLSFTARAKIEALLLIVFINNIQWQIEHFMSYLPLRKKYSSDPYTSLQHFSVTVGQSVLSTSDQDLDFQPKPKHLNKSKVLYLWILSVLTDFLKKIGLLRLY